MQRVHAGKRFLPPPVAGALSRMPDSDLSARELEVLHLLVAGKSNKEIAQSLGITEATVKSHVSAILMRLNVSDRRQASPHCSVGGCIYRRKKATYREKKRALQRLINSPAFGDVLKAAPPRIVQGAVKFNF